MNVLNVMSWCFSTSRHFPFCVAGHNMNLMPSWCLLGADGRRFTTSPLHSSKENWVKLKSARKSARTASHSHLKCSKHYRHTNILKAFHKNEKHRKTPMNVWSIRAVQASCSSPSSRSQWPWAWCSDWAAPFSRPPRATRRCSRCPWRSRACSPWRPAAAAIAPGLGMLMDVFSMC